MENKNWKRNPSAPVALAVLLGLATPTFAQTINVTVDGEVVPFPGQAPVQQSGSVLVPLRGVFEKLGATVLYDNATRSILATKGATTVKLQIGSANATVNGENRTLSLPAQTRNGSTLVPLRFVSEALGADVRWVAASRTVVISTTGNSGIANNTSGTGGLGNTTASGPVTVSSLRHSASGPLRAGETLTVTLTGTPGGEAYFTIPGVDKAQSAPLRETSPGTYVGTFTLPTGVNIKEATVLAHIKKGGQTSPILQAAQPLTVDSQGPTLAGLSPAPGAAVAPGKPLIYGTISDAGTGVGAGNTTILLNGKDVTSQATVTESFFSLRPDADLPLGKNTVAVTVRDSAGNETRKTWDFTVSAAEALVQELTFTPTDQRLEPGDEITVQLKARPGGNARFSVGETVKNRRMTEQSPGVYVGSYTVRKGDSLAEAPVSATFTLNGRTVTQTAERPISIAAGAPVAPTITSPTEGQALGSDTITITGKAAPNATVRYHIKYQAAVIGVGIGGTVRDGEVQADANGNWKVEGIRLSTLPGIRNPNYTLEVESVGASGETSERAAVSFKRQ